MKNRQLRHSLCIFALCSLCLCGSFSSAAGKRPMVVDDLYRFRRVSDPQISPDGSQVVYVVGIITDPAKNKSHSNLWLAAADGKTPPRQLTTRTPAGRRTASASCSSPRDRVSNNFGRSTWAAAKPGN